VFVDVPGDGEAGVTEDTAATSRQDQAGAMQGNGFAAAYSGVHEQLKQWRIPTDGVRRRSWPTVVGTA
jgi:hypothetical protein